MQKQEFINATLLVKELWRPVWSELTIKEIEANDYDGPTPQRQAVMLANYTAIETLRGLMSTTDWLAIRDLLDIKLIDYLDGAVLSGYEPTLIP